MNDGPNTEVWLVEDDGSLRWVLEQAFSEAGLACRSFEDAATCREALESGAPDVLMTDIRLPGEDGLGLLDHLREARPDLPVIVVTAHSDLEHAVAAYRRGAFEYLPKPFDVDEAVALVRRAVGTETAAPAPAEPAERRPLVGRSAAMQALFRAVGRLSGSTVPVLIRGESGTGKELVARALHDHSPRTDGLFVALNTAAIPAELLESELFGHEKGAFTGATERRVGRFEEADGGTLFLDEIGDMSSALQTRLLRVLAEGEFYRVGGERPIAVDVRIIAATHQDLERAVREGRFREDLYHRLDVIQIPIPPLRERREDIPELMEHHLTLVAEELGVLRKHLSKEVIRVLEAWDWPGNVRELVNLCRRLTVLAPGREIHRNDLPREMLDAPTEADRPDWLAGLSDWASRELEAGRPDVAQRAVELVERALIASALQATGGHKGNAAELLGWGRNTLTRKMQQYGL